MQPSELRPLPRQRHDDGREQDGSAAQREKLRSLGHRPGDGRGGDRDHDRVEEDLAQRFERLGPSVEQHHRAERPEREGGGAKVEDRPQHRPGRVFRSGQPRRVEGQPGTQDQCGNAEHHHRKPRLHRALLVPKDDGEDEQARSRQGSIGRASFPAGSAAA